MSNPLILKRLCGTLSFAIAVVCFLLNLYRGAELVHAAFTALWVMMGSALVLTHTFRRLANLLARFLPLDDEYAEHSQSENPVT